MLVAPTQDRSCKAEPGIAIRKIKGGSTTFLSGECSLAVNPPAVMLLLVSWEQIIGNLVIVPSPLIVGSI